MASIDELLFNFIEKTSIEAALKKKNKDKICLSDQELKRIKDVLVSVQYSDITSRVIIESEKLRETNKERVGEIKQSICDYGVDMPRLRILVRARDGEFELLGGFHRVNACRELAKGKNKVVDCLMSAGELRIPAQVLPPDTSDDDAMLMAMRCNLLNDTACGMEWNDYVFAMLTGRLVEGLKPRTLKRIRRIAKWLKDAEATKLWFSLNRWMRANQNDFDKYIFRLDVRMSQDIKQVCLFAVYAGYKEHLDCIVNHFSGLDKANIVSELEKQLNSGFSSLQKSKVEGSIKTSMQKLFKYQSEIVVLLESQFAGQLCNVKVMFENQGKSVSCDDLCQQIEESRNHRNTKKGKQPTADDDSTAPPNENADTNTRSSGSGGETQRMSRKSKKRKQPAADDDSAVPPNENVDTNTRSSGSGGETQRKQPAADGDVLEDLWRIFALPHFERIRVCPKCKLPTHEGECIEPKEYDASPNQLIGEFCDVFSTPSAPVQIDAMPPELGLCFGCVEEDVVLSWRVDAEENLQSLKITANGKTDISNCVVRSAKPVNCAIAFAHQILTTGRTKKSYFNKKLVRSLNSRLHRNIRRPPLF